MKQLFHEPLTHFLVIGAMLFAAFSLLNRSAGADPGRIVVTEGQTASMSETFTRTWQRPPTRAELTGLIRDRVREEVYYREALALGLDRDDTVIRRRLRQKMEFISADTAVQTQPSEGELNAYLQAYAEKFRVPPQLTLRQVFLDPDKRSASLERDALQMLARLNRAGDNADISAMGDRIMLDSDYDALAAGEIARMFGDGFATAVDDLPVGQWRGPVKSGFGVHLVLVSRRVEGRLPALAEVRDAVQREWEDARRLEANEKFFQDLLRNYKVTIEGSMAADAESIAAGK